MSDIKHVGSYELIWHIHIIEKKKSFNMCTCWPLKHGKGRMILCRQEGMLTKEGVTKIIIYFRQ